MSESEMSQIEDLPRGGPLESYRKSASFNWKKMKLFFEELDLIQYKKNIWETLRGDTLWSRPLEEPSVVKQKEIAQLRYFCFFFFSKSDFLT